MIEIRELIEEGWESAKRGELVDGDEVFDRIEAELEALERGAKAPCPHKLKHMLPARRRTHGS